MILLSIGGKGIKFPGGVWQGKPDMQGILVYYLLLFSKLGEIIAYVYDCEMTL